MLGLMSQIVTRAEIQICSRVLYAANCTQNRHFTKYHDIGKPKLTITVQPVRFVSASTNVKEGLISRIKQKLTATVSDKTKARYAGIVVYEKCADSINWTEFFEYFGLEDSFHSWFLAIELHMWMCMVVGISEKFGRVFRNSLVDAMWKDVEVRLTELKNDIPSSSERKKYLKGITEQFNAALVSYDEGLLCDDKVLAASIWRTLYSFENMDPRQLEKAVHYVRKQVSHLNSLHSEDYIKKGSVTFLSVKIIHQEYSASA
ncbi:hypothetical protein JTE90_001748 [Oedothorax gibbosus]|uniref:Ubiquinol-cytochrome c chaperone domain-containing protein n=1 Tax=Oedothorax gibbosus TaxID=931172 RepID=A0AAV6V718_9ARAC|nr:hypothetical protein JTE90_001748 [Oedothorax gibbosus]